MGKTAPHRSPQARLGARASHRATREDHAVPASRSRTEHWKDQLSRLHERGGALEISIRPADGGLPTDNHDLSGASGPEVRGGDVVWRVKIVAISNDAIAVEPPAAFGDAVPLRPGIELVGAMTIGQNRWMFLTRTLAVRPGAGGQPGQLILTMPEKVERCTRRGFFRISTAELRLPVVQAWPLFDPLSVVAAETSNRVRILDAMEGHQSPDEPGQTESILLPDVGPAFTGRMLNISGGGLGLLVDQADAQTATSRAYIWLRMDLRPIIPEPVAVTGRIAHTHLDSTQALYLGVAFDFAANPAHRQFVSELFAQYMEELQRRQARTSARAA